MTFFKKNIFVVFMLSFLVLVPVLTPVVIFAQDDDTDISDTPNDIGKVSNPIKTDNVNGFLKSLLTGVVTIGIPIVALAIIYCGFLFVAAIGNSEKIKKAKDALIYTLIGAAVLLGSWAIAQMITETVIKLGA